MDYIHIVNGDSAAEVLRQALQHAHRQDRVVALRDDLAVGPLRDVDDDATLRAGFWQRVLPRAGIDFPAELSAERATLRALADDTSEVVAWHGDSSGDQLTLRRLAYHLRQTPARLNEIGLKAADLDNPHLRPGDAVAVGMASEAVVAARLSSIAPISVLRIGRLALEWRELRHLSTQTRRWRRETFEGGTYAQVDAVLLAQLTSQWMPAARVIGTVMGTFSGFFATDAFLLWRCRELHAAGQLALRGDGSDPSGLRDCELKRE